MIPLTREADHQVEALLAYYRRLGRLDAVQRLIATLERASARLSFGERGEPAPRPYPEIAKLNLGFRWIKQDAYWIAFEAAGQAVVIAGVFYERADIPSRL